MIGLSYLYNLPTLPTTYSKFTFITLVLHFSRHHIAAIHTDGFRAQTRLNNLRPWRQLLTWQSTNSGAWLPDDSEKRNNGLDDWKNSMTQQQAKFLVLVDDSETYVRWKVQKQGRRTDTNASTTVPCQKWTSKKR